ncbi:MAG TPA: tetratricopeptide repeat protein, partial [Gemmataceae bacterium]|nr:tetratricopeptide repeat protein [Gemmataceae bacterium]
LGLLGTWISNRPLAARLHDDDKVIRLWTVDALWSLWFQADTSANNQELRRLMGIGDPHEAVARLDALIRKAPHFAEAYNQRAILYFRLEQYHKSITDCETVIRLNPFHFGAQAGMAQCFMKLKKPRAALKAFRVAHIINPELAGVEETIQFLEEVLGEEGKK